MPLPFPSCSENSIWPLEVPYGFLFTASVTGVKWDKVHRYAYYQGLQLPVSLEPYLAEAWSWAWQQARAVAGSPLPLPPPVLPLWQPRPHQTVAIHAMEAAFNAKLPGFVLADDVGVGKTLATVAWLQRQLTSQSPSVVKFGLTTAHSPGEVISVISAASAALASPWLLIVTTCSAVPHWRRTLLQAGVVSPNILLLNYEQLGKIMGHKASLSPRRKGRAKRLASRGIVPRFDFVVFDEAHRGRNPTTATSTAMRRLANAAGFTLWLSATIGRHPVELSYLSPLLSAVTGEKVPSDTLSDFGAWCMAHHLGVKRGAFGGFVPVDLDEPARRPEAQAGLERTHQLLFVPQKVYPAVALRRLPQEIAGWPALERSLFPVAITPEAASELNSTLVSVFQEELQAGPPSARAGRAASASLVRMLRLRQAFSQARIAVTVEQIIDLLDSGKQVAVSVAFLDTLERLKIALTTKKIAVSTISGSITGSAREAQRVAFQTGRAVVCLFTIEEAISLHQGEVLGASTKKEAGGNDVGRVMLIHDVRWSPLQMTQIEGRCHRDGALAPVIWQFANHTLEEKLVHTVLGGVSTMKSLLGDETAILETLRAQVYQAAHVISPR